ncbi:MAG TPA: flagellar basal body P-ring protein FlgI [Geminicoccaceae bacterium]|jgi:flagellar P-ring protein FlgI|nr:flagellar basal body P-ring protein FlgI [Geminicoccaceae bacterium]
MDRASHRLRQIAAVAGRVPCALLAAALLAATPGSPAAANSRIKDITDFEGVRDNLLVGYGLVVGLNGTGDSLRNSAFTAGSLEAMLERLGVATRGQDLKTKNVAAVMVTATLPPFARQGSHLDVSVSALGDAKSLEGGTLLVTPLYGADGEIYAVSQGQLAIGGFVAQGAAESVTKGVPTSARIAAGGIIEREVDFELDQLKRVRLALRNPDFTTAARIAHAINDHFRSSVAQASDPATVILSVPAAYQGRTAALLTEVEQLAVEPDQIARVLIDEKSGIIVMGDNVRISQVAVAQGNLTVRVTETPQVSQPNPLAEGDTVVVPRTSVQVDEGDNRHMVVLQEGVSLQELVAGLNALGVGPRDLISILQAIKAAGALQAEIVVM